LACRVLGVGFLADEAGDSLAGGGGVTPFEAGVGAGLAPYVLRTQPGAASRGEDRVVGLSTAVILRASNVATAKRGSTTIRYPGGEPLLVAFGGGSERRPAHLHRRERFRLRRRISGWLDRGHCLIEQVVEGVGLIRGDPGGLGGHYAGRGGADDGGGAWVGRVVLSGAVPNHADQLILYAGDPFPFAGTQRRDAVSEVLPSTEREAAAFRTELVARLARLPEHTFLSVEELILRHRDPQDGFSFADYDFIHAPGGHAPMVDFRDNPWFGEALHLARENDVRISLICHAPIAMTSTWQRVDPAGKPYRVTDNPFLTASITTVPKRGEKIALTTSYPHVPGEHTRLTYYVDEAIEEARFTVSTTLNPTAIKLIHEPSAGLLTGNGPQAIDVQAAKIREIVSTSLAGAAQRPGE
jgi:hypothetical protein